MRPDSRSPTVLGEEGGLDLNTAEVAAAIAVPGLLFLAALLLVASAKEWVAINVTVSVKFVPASKRAPRTEVRVVQVPASDPAGQPQPVDIAARRTGT
jgi:hypothetical protein